MEPDPIQQARAELAAAEVGVTEAEAAVIVARNREKVARRNLMKALRATQNQAKKAATERVKVLVREHTFFAFETVATLAWHGHDECRMTARCGARFNVALSIREAMRIQDRYGFSDAQRAVLKRTADRVNHSDESEVVVPTAFLEAFG